MSVEASSPATASRSPSVAVDLEHALLFASPAAALCVGVAAEWMDFRALRYPILLLVFAAVLLTSAMLDRLAPHASSRLAALRAVVVGVLTWGAAEALYVVIHAARGEPFSADRFGPQWTQALGLIAVHAIVLGTPTGVAAAAALRLRAWRTARA